MEGFKHSVKVPTQYKRTAAVLKEALENRKSLKTLIAEEKHARLPALHKALRLYSDNRSAIENAIEKTEILIENPRLSPSLCRVLITELIYGRRNLNGESKPVQTVRNYKERLLAVITGGAEIPIGSATKEEHQRYRYVRVNSNLFSLQETFEYLDSEGFQRKNNQPFDNYNDFLAALKSLEESEYMMDMHLDDMLVFHPKSKQYWARNPYVSEKKLLLQDKGPSLAVEILRPEAGSTLLDMCAAPGMKTIMACNRMQNKGKIYASDLNPQRYEVLCNMTLSAGCSIVHPMNVDSLTLDDTKCPNVEYIIVDPSCSGSGMQRVTIESEEKDPKRLRNLGYLQFRMLSHAMTAFPNAKRIVYSTCSLYEEENEKVVEECLQKIPHFKLLSGKKSLRNKWNNFGDTKYKNIGKHCIYARPKEDLTDGMFIALFERCMKKDENI